MAFSVDELKDPHTMKLMAESLDEYLSVLENYVIINGLTEKEYDKAVETVKKLIKKLKKGDTSVYTEDLEAVVDDLNDMQYPF